MIAAMYNFLEAGGVVLWLIVALNIFLWSLVMERIWFLQTWLPVEQRKLLHFWQQRDDKKSWQAKQIRAYLLSKLELSIDQYVPMIRTIMLVFPLLGLLGTVTGMIEVFNVISVTGGGDAKPMAYGVSRATIPTMAGMVSAIAALLAFNFLKARCDRAKQKIANTLYLEH